MNRSTMSEPVLFEWIEIEGFRGFAKRQRLELDASVVILAGPNGTGKTSFFDAVQWLLVGTLERLEPWRVRRNTEHVVNQYHAATGGQATVSAGVRIDDRRVELRRRGRYDGSQLEWHEEHQVLYERDAERALADSLTPVGRMSLQRSLLSSGLLQQDVIRDVLEDKPAERYEQLAAILGLNAIAGFPVAARKRAERLAGDGTHARQALADLEVEAREARDRIAALRDRASKAPDVAALQAHMAERVHARASVLQLRGELPLSSAEAQELRVVASLAADILVGLAADIVPMPEESAPGSQELKALRGACDTAAQAVNEAQGLSARAAKLYEDEREVSSRLVSLAAEALPLLGDKCPVCGQTIDSNDVGDHLRHLLSQGSARLPELQRLRDEATGEVARREGEAEQASRALAEALRRDERLTEARTRQDAWRVRLREAVKQLDERFDLRNRETLAHGDGAALVAASDALRDIARTSSELVSAFGLVGETAAVAGVQVKLANLEERIVEARERAAKASATEDGARTLQRAAVRAAASVTDERFAVLLPVIQDVYVRLDPHPSFTHLRFSVEVYRERGIASPQVRDPERELNADPLLVFSSSQINVVALSAFLALSWAAGEDAMPFLLLDDPLQSLDDVNALGFSDLCRHMRTRRQLIVSTHDRRLAGLLARKLAPRTGGHRTRLLRFIAWSREGPLIDASEVESQVDQGERRVLVPS
jgi:DNA repair exonuclease SbcCD ATPase subunit